MTGLSGIYAPGVPQTLLLAAAAGIVQMGKLPGRYVVNHLRVTVS
jgi:hypothetical protein